MRLWDEHAQQIYRYCFRRTTDRELAEDLTSIVFLEAWRRRAKIELSTATELPWLYGIAANVLRNQRRKQRRYRAALARMPRQREEDDLAADAVERVTEQQRLARLMKKLESLPQVEQDALSLCAWENLSPKEVSVALGIPEGTVRTRLHRARKRLRTLDDTANEYPPVSDLARVEGERS